MRTGQPINIHEGKGRVFAITLGAEDSSLVGRDAAEAFRSHPGFLLVAAVRGEEVVSPTHVELLEHGDCLVIMASGQANAGIMQTRREMTDLDS